MKDTWVFVVDPTQVKRTAGVQTPFDLDSEGNLIEVLDNHVQSRKELVIPFSLKHLRMLCSYPLERKDDKFDPCPGVDIHYDDGRNTFVGVAPGVSVEVLQELGF